VLENNWPRVPVEQSGEASDMMRTGSVPARRRFELIRLAQRKVSSPWQNFPRSLESPQTRFDVISIYSQWAVLSGELMEERSRLIILVQGGSSSAQRNGSRIAEKKRIAQCASELSADGESVILNGGSTTRLFALELGGKKDLTVVTNSLGIAAAGGVSYHRGFSRFLRSDRSQRR
jgi:hypothetical protein